MSGLPLVDITADGHIHTRLCNHAQGEMENYVESALAHSLCQITFLEHIEVGIRSPRRTWLARKDIEYYFCEGKRLTEKYKDRILIKVGAEVGINLQAMDEIKRQLTEYSWDTIGLSYHFYNRTGQHYNMVSRRQEDLLALVEAGVDRVITEYFNGLILGLQHVHCTVVCHLDAVLRHYPDRWFSKNHWQQIDELLLLMKKKGTALEVNTSGFTIRDEPYPCKRIILRAIESGIPLVAGSDAHRPEQVGRFFDKLSDWLHSISPSSSGGR